MQIHSNDRVIQVSIPELATYSNESLRKTLPISFNVWLKRVIVAFFVVLITFVISEGLVRLLIVYAQPELSHAKEFDYKFQLAQRYAKENQPGILILGDSLIDFALYPELFAARLSNAGLNLGITNLAVPGNSYEHDLLLLKTAIAQGHKPVLVIVNAHLRLFNQSYYKTQVQNRKNFERSYLNRCLVGSKRSWNSTLRCELEKNIFLIRYRDFLKMELDTMPGTLLNPKKRMSVVPNLFPKAEFSPDGWTPGYEIYSKQAFSAKFSSQAHFKQLATDLKEFHWTDLHFSRLADFCRKEKLPLMVVWLPEHPVNAQVYRAYGLSLKALTTSLDNTLKKEQVIWVNLRDNFKSSEIYMDPEHVNPEGAILVTRQVADIVWQKRNMLRLNPIKATKP